LDCNHVFENKRRPRDNFSKSLWFQFSHEKQSYKSLAKKSGCCERTIQRLLEKVEPVILKTECAKTVIIMDTFYFRRGFGVMVFRDSYNNKNIFWKYLPNETNAEYISGIEHLISNGWSILGIVCDGKRGLFTAFKGIPVQMCQFHQTAIITRYLTQNPKLLAGKELSILTSTLTKVGREEFSDMLEKWHKKWADFLKEKTLNDESGRWFYTHRKLRSAYRSLKSNIPYLFIYLDYPELKIPNTTNSLEGVFSGLETKVRVHTGLKDERKIKLVNELLA